MDYEKSKKAWRNLAKAVAKNGVSYKETGGPQIRSTEGSGYTPDDGCSLIGQGLNYMDKISNPFNNPNTFFT